MFYCEVWKRSEFSSKHVSPASRVANNELAKEAFLLDEILASMANLLPLKSSSSCRLHKSLLAGFCISRIKTTSPATAGFECSPSCLQLIFKSFHQASKIKENGKLEGRTLWKRFHGKLHCHVLLHLISLYFLRIVSATVRLWPRRVSFFAMLYIYFFQPKAKKKETEIYLMTKIICDREWARARLLGFGAILARKRLYVGKKYYTLCLLVEVNSCPLK